MSPRFIKIILFTIVIAGLFGIVYTVLPKIGSIHPKIDTAGKIIYISNSDNFGKPHVFIIGSDGAGATDLTPGPQSCADPVFSPDGSEIAYVSDKDGQQQVYVMDADGKQAHKVTIGSAAKDQPEFSPDGKTLTFLTQGTITSLDLQSNDTELILPSPGSATSSSTSALIDITHAPVIQYAWAPGSGSPGGGGPAIAAVQESSEGDLQVLTLLPTIDGAPKEIIYASNIGLSWSPDGSKLYASILGGKAGQEQQSFSGILTFAADGTPEQKPPLGLTTSSAVGPVDPVISPDGKQAIFTVVNQPDLAHQETIGLFAEPVDCSSPPRQLLKGTVSGVRFSPDNAHILMLLPSQTPSNQDLWVAPLNGSSSPINLTHGAGNVTSAEWSPSLPKSNG